MGMTEEEKQNIKEQFNDIVSNGIVPILKAANFKRRGNNFHAHMGDVDWCINIQKSRWGFDDYYNTWQFTINIGITWKDYIICLFNKACDFPLESSCPLRARIGNFMGKGDYWFVLRPYHDHLPIKEQICTTIKNKVLPLLYDINCFDDAWKYTIKNRSWYRSLTKLFHIGTKQEVFEINAFGFYMLCLESGKEEKANIFRKQMERCGANTEFLDKILDTYKKYKEYKASR